MSVANLKGNTQETGLQFNITLQNMLPDIKECRICLQSDNQMDFIEPCKCSGSLKFVHESCLRQWVIRNKQRGQSFIECELCKEKIQFHVEISTKCGNCEDFKKKVSHSTSFFTFIIIMVVICSGFIGYLLFLLSTLQEDDSVMKVVIIGISAFTLFLVILFSLMKLFTQFILVKTQQIGKIKEIRNLPLRNFSGARVFPGPQIVDLD